MNSQTIVGEVRRRLTEIPERTELADEQLRQLVEAEVDRALASSGQVDSEKNNLMRRQVVNEILGFGPLQDFLDDSAVSEIMVNGFDEIWVERNGVIELSGRTFDSEDQLLVVIDRMVRSSGRRVDQSSPMVDARLPDGSRLNVILPPLAVDGPALTVRKFTSSGLTTDDLVASGALSPDAARFLGDAVASRMNILVSGGTGTGKTTVLNILSSFIDRDERIVTIEDAVELTLRLPNLVRLEARPGNSEGAGEINVRELVRNSLRMRPNRIIVGEVRAVREQIASAIDLVVHLTRDSKGRRFVTTITEVSGMESDVVTTADLFVREHSAVGGAVPRLVTTGLISQRLDLRRARASS